MRASRFFVIVFLLGFTSLILACQTTATISFENDKITIELGETYDLKPIVSNAEGTDLVNYSYSGDVVTITNNQITAQKAGTAVITASLKADPKVSCTIEVTVREVDVTITNTDTLKVGDVVKMELSKEYDNVVWSVTDPNFADITADGTLTCKKEGKVTVVATIGLTVIQKEYNLAASGLEMITATIGKMGVSESQTIVLSYTPSDYVATNIKYTSTDENIATVSSDGVITALAAGNTVIEIAVADKKVQYELEVVDFTLAIDGNSTMAVSATQKLTVAVNPNFKTPQFTSSDEAVATVDEEGVVTALKAGNVTITASIGEKSAKLDIQVSAVMIEIDGSTEMYESSTQTLSVITSATNPNITYSSLDQSVLMVDANGVVTAIGQGTTKVVVSVDGVEKQFEITVLPAVILSLDVEGAATIEISEEIELVITKNPATATSSLTFTSSKPAVATVDANGKITGISAGTAVIIIKAEDAGGYIYNYSIEVLGTDKKRPVIYVDETISPVDIRVNYNTTFDPLLGVKAEDDRDGDITDKIVMLNEVDTKSMLAQTITYTVKDKAGNESRPFVRNVVIYWDYPVSFIGHMGSYSGVANTEGAFINAIRVHGYQALECDIKQTKDGVFVLCHDDNLDNYGNKGVVIASKTYAELKDLTLSQTRGGIKYTDKICTLERYLQICKNYNVIPVIELKSSAGITSSDTSRMQALMDVIEKAGMIDKAILLGSNWTALKWTRNNGYAQVKCQYLVNSIESQDYYNRCIENDFDISFNISYSNSAEWIKRYQAAGKKVSCYTFSQYSTVSILQSWIDLGVDYVTVDVIKPYEVKLPVNVNQDLPTYTVTFKTEEGEVLATRKVLEGAAAISPIDPSKDGYKFTGWDKDFSNITADLEVIATFELVNYTIKFNDNINQITESAWENKEAFVLEFFTDFYNWLASNVDNIAELTLSGTTYSLTKNEVTVTWTNVEQLRAIDKYDFEKTLSNYIYKPVTRIDNQPVEPVEDENYFLNSKQYVVKYRALDAWFLNCCINNYSTYDRTFTPTSAGKIQILFRFQQWCQGTSISSFNVLPVKYVGSSTSTDVAEVPATITYTIMDEVTLPKATCEGKTFIGWYTDVLGEEGPVVSIPVGTHQDYVLYAKWQ